MNPESSVPAPDLQSVVEALELTVLRIVDDHTVRPVPPSPAWFDAIAENLVGAPDGAGNFRIDPRLPFESFADAVIWSGETGEETPGTPAAAGIDPVHLDCDVPQADGKRVWCRISRTESGGKLWIVVDRIAAEADRRRSARQAWRSNDLASAGSPAGCETPIGFPCGEFPGSAVLEAVFAASSDGIVVTGSGEGEVYANPHACELLGLSASLIRDRPDWSAMRSMLIDAALSKAVVRKLCDRIETGLTSRLVTEWEIVRPVARRCRIEVIPNPRENGDLPGTVWIVRESKAPAGDPAATESDSPPAGGSSGEDNRIGQLAAGIAHDFNNLLAVMIGNLGLAEESLRRPGESDAELRNEISNSLSDARAAAGRAAGLVRKLLSYSRLAPVEEETADLNAVILAIVEKVRGSIRPDIILQLDLEDDLWSAKVDAAHLADVLEELCRNGSNAARGDGATIQIQSRNIELTDTIGYEILNPGSYAVISVADNGSGIAIEDLDHVFEPFFTTRQIASDTRSGDGRGMGLASARGAVRQLGGDLTCSSLPGEGAVFNIYLPRHHPGSAGEVWSPPRPAAVPAHDLPDRRRGRNGGRRVLIVDDDPSVRSLVQRALRREGYSTTTAEDGQDAISCVNREGESAFDLIILDLCMPRMGGFETYEVLTGMKIRIPIVISSGYVVELNRFEKKTGARPAAFLPKPYSVESLLEMTASQISALRENN